MCDLRMSNYSKSECLEVAKKLKLENTPLVIMFKRLKTLNIPNRISEVKKELQDYTNGPNETHIVKGAILSKAKFLITYNLKLYKIDKNKIELWNNYHDSR